jgi:hypothetical protein
MSATTPSSVTNRKFILLSLGCSVNAIELLVPATPSVHDATDLKACCYDYLANLLLLHAPLYSSAKLITAFSHIPGSTYNAALESELICSLIHSAFFQVDNLVGLGFRNRHGAPITNAITNDLSARPSDIYYFAFRSTVDPAALDNRISLTASTLEFCLALP